MPLDLSITDGVARANFSLQKMSFPELYPKLAPQHRHICLPKAPFSNRRLSNPGVFCMIPAYILGHFLSKAADHLCRTQGAVSRQVQQLEAHYRCALFVRHASGLTLTAEGNALLTVAVNLLTQLVRHADVPAHSESALALRLPSTLAIRWLLPRLSVINFALPRTELRIHTSADDPPDFTTPDVDVMVVRRAGHWAGMDAIPLFQND